MNAGRNCTHPQTRCFRFAARIVCPGRSGTMAAVRWILLFLAMHLAASGCGAVELTTEERAFLQTKGSIVFVSQTNYPPFEFTDSDGQLEGMMLDVVRWLAVELGFQPLFLDLSLAKAQEAVQTGTADVLTSLFDSEQRQAHFAFTQPLFKVPALIFVQTNRTDISTLRDLQAKTIAMQQGDYAAEYLHSQGINCTILPTRDFAEAVDQVIAGRADAVIGDEQIVLFHLFKHGLAHLIKSVAEPLYIGSNCMAASRDNQLLITIFDKGIDKARKTGVLAKIGTKWLGTSYRNPQGEMAKYLWPTVAAVAALLLGSGAVWLWNIQLRSRVRAQTATLREQEQTLREREHNLLSYFNSMDDLVFVGDMAGHILHVNNAVVDKLGYSRDELNRLLFLDMHPPALRCEAESIVHAMVAGHVHTCPLPLQAKNGTLIPVETRVWPGQWTGAPCLFGIAKDLSKEQEALQKFNRLFAANPIPMALSRTDDQIIVEVNAAFERTTGFSREEVLGQRTVDLHLFAHPEKHQEVATLLHQNGRIADCELTVRRKDGALLEGLFSGEVIRSQGETYFLTAMLDQTDRLHLEQTLRQSERQYRHLFESMIDLYCRFDHQGIITLVSPSVTRLTGFTAEELIGSDIRGYAVFPEDGFSVLSMMAKNGFVEKMEMAIRAKDGTRLWLSCNAWIAYDEQGRFAWIEGIARDVTERRQATQALQRELEFRGTIIDNIAEGLCVCHAIPDAPFHRFTVWNRRMAEITGYTMEAVNQLGWDRAVYAEAEEQKRAAAQIEAMLDGDYQSKEERVITRADGEQRTLAISTVFVGSEHGAAHVLAVMRDITEERAVEIERRQLNRELQEAQKVESLGRMAGATAHHFNNMLGAVIGYLDLLKESVSSHETEPHRFLGNAMIAAQRAAKLSHFMLRYAGQGGEVSPLRDFSREVRLAIQRIAETLPRGLVLETLVEPGLPGVAVSADDLGWILSNLVANSVEALHGQADGMITVAVRIEVFDAASLRQTIGTPVPPPGPYVVLEVSDNGSGMEEQTIVRMFDPFFSTKFVGRGLGLAIVGGIVRAIRGAILVTSEAGQGTQVQILIPALNDGA